MLHFVVFDSLGRLIYIYGLCKSNVVLQQSKALKGLASCGPLPVYPGDTSDKSDTASLRGIFVPEFHVPGREIPLDLSVKTYVRLVSSSPLNWLVKPFLI